MAMNGSAWGTAVADAIAAIGIAAGTPITSGQLASVWQAICAEHDTHITNNAEVTVTGVTSGSSSAPGTID